MARPTFIPKYEQSENIIKNRMLISIPDTWRKDVGDFTYDMVAPASPEIKLLQIQQDEILKNSFAMYAEGDYLDYKLREVGLTRGQPTPNVRMLNVHADAGVAIPAGHKAVTVVLDSGGNPLEYTFNSTTVFSSTGVLPLEISCKTSGAIGNVNTGSEFIILPPIPGVRSIIDVGTVIPGTDKESDENAWQRYDFKVKNPDTGGNRNDYVRWVQEVTGVEKRIKVIPRWAGNGTVKIVLIGADYLPATPELVTEVQTYLDPLLDAVLEAENMIISGYGVSIDTEQTDDSGASVKMIYDLAGGGAVKYGMGGVLEMLIGTENTFIARVKIKADQITGATDLLQITVRDRGTLQPVKQAQGGSVDARVTVKGNQLSTDFTFVELPFYWDGLQPIEIEVNRLASDTATTVWVDKVNFAGVYGQGLGYGKAPGGARVYVKAADAVTLNISANVVYSAGANPETVKSAFVASVNNYLKDIIFVDNQAVVYARIGGLLIGTNGVSNYTDLLINGGTADILLGVEQAPVLGTVTI